MKTQVFTIYVADDNPQYLELLAASLRNDLTEVTGFRHYVPLLEAIKNKNCPDLVVLDHRYGDDEKGLELLRQIKSRYASVHVILISAQERVEVAIEALKCGASDYLEKNGEELSMLQESVARIMHFEMEKRRSSMRLKQWGTQLGLWFRGMRAAAVCMMLCALFLSGCGTMKIGGKAKAPVELPPVLTQQRNHLTSCRIFTQCPCQTRKHLFWQYGKRLKTHKKTVCLPQ